MPTLGHDRIRKRLPADQTRKRNLFIVVRVIGLGLSCHGVDGEFIELPTGEVVASVVQEFTGVAIATEPGFYETLGHL
jgi:hypothetical protein